MTNNPHALPLTDVAVGILWQGERFLAACRPAGTPRAGFWEFPGGKFAKGETLETALCREFMEELGVHPTVWQPWQVVEHAYPEIFVRLHFVHITAWQGQPQALEGQTLHWVTVAEALHLNFLPADLALLPALQAPR